MGTANATLYAKWPASGKTLWGTTPTTAPNQTVFNSVAADASGNVYAAGFQYGTGTFFYGTGVTATGISGGETPVLVKYDPSGKALWARSPTLSSGAAGSSYFNAVAVDSSGTVYAAGKQNGIATYDYGGKTVTGPDANNNIIIVKYDSSGTVLWAKSATTGPAYSGFYALATDSSNAVYAAGYQSGPNLFNYGDGITATGYNSNSNVLLVKYSSSGTALWARTVSAASADSEYLAVAVGSSGNVFAAGYQTGTNVSYGSGGTPTGTGTSCDNALLVKYSSSGDATWAQIASGADNSVFNSITVDSSQNVYAAGSQTNSGTYTYGAGTTTTAQAPILSDNPVIVKFDHAGGGLWARTTSTGAAFAYSNFKAVAVTAEGVYAAGLQGTTATFTYGNGVTATGVNTNSSSDCAVLVRYDASGNAVWAKTISGGTSGTGFYAVAVDSLADVFTAGYQTGSNTFSYGDGVTVTGAGSSGSTAMLLKYIQ